MAGGLNSTEENEIQVLITTILKKRMMNFAHWIKD